MRPGGENNPVVAAAAAAGGAAAARAATGTERGAHFSGEREGGVSGERAGLQGEADVYDPWEDPRFRESWKHIRGAG